MNREECDKLEDTIHANYLFTTIDEQVHLATLYTHLNETIALINILLDQLAFKWDNNEYLWWANLKHWEELIYI
jgi:spore coat protein CotF